MGNKLAYPEVDLSGKVALITGGNTGIGYETAKGLARLGAHTFIACRSQERAENAIARMKEELGEVEQDSIVAAKPVNSVTNTGENKPDSEKSNQDSEDPSRSASDGDVDKSASTGSSDDNKPATPSEDEVKSKEDNGDQQATGKKDINIEYIPLDLASFESIKNCVRLFKEKKLPLHMLVNNAALLGPTFKLTKDDLESQIQINHLGPVLLTLELLPILLSTAESCGDVRILFVSSGGHFQAETFDPESFVKTEQNYKRLREYCNTKLYNVMSGYCLQRRLQNKNITVSSIHPGYVRTEIDRSFNDMTLLMAAHTVAKNIVARTPVDGAATSLNCAVNPELNSQQHFYYDSCKTKLSSASSRNEEFQEQMWKKTFEYLKDHLSPETIEKYGPREEEPAQAAEGTESVEEQDKKQECISKTDDENELEPTLKPDTENGKEQSNVGDAAAEVQDSEQQDAPGNN